MENLTDPQSEPVKPQNLSYNARSLASEVQKHHASEPEMRQGIYFGDVSLEDYSQGDLSQYYTGTIMAYTRKGKILPVFVMELEFTPSAVKAVVLVAEFDDRLRCSRKTVLLRNLKRFLITPSFVVRSSGDIHYMRYDCRKSYKKSAVMQMIKAQNLYGDSMNSSSEGVLKLVYCWMYPLLRSFTSEHEVDIISNNVLRLNNTVRIPHKNYRVGSYEDQELSTPFPALKDRYQDHIAKQSA